MARVTQESTLCVSVSTSGLKFIYDTLNSLGVPLKSSAT